MSMRDVIENWYEGEFVPYKNGSNDAVAFIGGTYKRHWTAKVARTLMRFWLNHWQWTIGTALATCGLVIALTRH
jgi:hypothetical protein